MFFSRHAATVSLLVRGESLEASMSSYLIKQLDAIDNVVVRTTTEVAEACGDGHLQRLVLSDRTSGEKQTVTRGLDVRVHRRRAAHRLARRRRGARRGAGSSRPDPTWWSTGSARRGWPLDRDPYHLESSVPGVFVAGDVRADSVKRVASAVGEGAMAVTLVHRYLAEQ